MEKYNNVQYWSAIRRINFALKRAYNFERHKIKHHNLIYQYSILIGQEIQEPTKNKCKEWLMNAYKEKQLPDFIKPSEGFYNTIEWRQIRIKVFDMYGHKCLKCGNEDFLQVDHIKPRSLYPELELDINNLQILCKSCNIKKSNKNEIDYRNTTN
jgi:5-methylcytosine-specific restriction endonuclease McrA